jgi:CBS domain-containing protein
MAKSKTETEEKHEAKAEEKTSATGETAVKEEPKAAAEQKEKTDENAQDQQAAVKKTDSEEPDTAPKNVSEKSKPQEPAAEEQTPAEENTEQAVEPDKAETTEQTDDANENAANQQPEAAAEEDSEDIDTDTSDKPVEEKTLATDESKDRPVSETIQRMNQSPATLPGEPVTPEQTQTQAASNASAPAETYAKDIMQKNVVWASDDDSVQQVLAKLQQHDTGYMMIGRDGILQGIVSKSDLTGAISTYLKPVFAKWRRPLDDATLQIKVKWIMSRPVQTISPETSLQVIMENMRQFGRRALPVVDKQDKVQGLVTVFDIFKVLLNNNPNISTVGNTPQAPPLA